MALEHGLVERRILQDMTDILRHRGPDDSGLYIQGNIGLGHRRLSIVDLQGGHQPMSNEDRTIWMTYNGEIYNHQDIRNRLVCAGHEYRSRSDTETLLHLYEESGVEGLRELRGMFAYALWDSRLRRLVLVRDRLGIKPLYYFFNKGNLVWASEIKSILKSGYVSPRLRMESLPDYLANRCTSDENTLFEGIKRIPPGHFLVWQEGGIAISRYWELPSNGTSRFSDDEEAVESFRELFEESVRLRMMSDVPLGMFLSGGIDSSAISAVMSRISEGPVKTFSVAFDETEANELPYARIASRAFKTEHHEITISVEQFFNALPRLVWHEDEPVAFPSSVPLYFVSALAGQHVKVVLTGEGSDELLVGYARYPKTLINMRLGDYYRSIFPPGMRSRIRKSIFAMPARSTTRQKLSRTFLCLDSAPESIYFDNFSVFPRKMIPELLHENIRDSLSWIDPYRIQMDFFNRGGNGSLLDGFLYADIKTYLHELLMKQDQMSMAASIESRVPFLDHKLVEFAAALPLEMKLRGGETKYILKKSMEGIVPGKILRRKKMGFPVPIKKWFQKDRYLLIKDYLLGERAASRGCFNSVFIARLLNEHREGIQDHSERLWSLLNFELWNRIFIDGEALIQWAATSSEFSG